MWSGVTRASVLEVLSVQTRGIEWHADRVGGRSGDVRYAAGTGDTPAEKVGLQDGRWIERQSGREGRSPPVVNPPEGFSLEMGRRLQSGSGGRGTTASQPGDEREDERREANQ
jgi:hypothetical protein